METNNREGDIWLRGKDPPSATTAPAHPQRKTPGEEEESWQGEIMGPSTSPGTQSFPCLPYSLQEEREKAREQITLKVTEIIMRMAFLNLGNP